MSTACTAEEYIVALAGLYATLQDSRTVSGTSSARKFGSYVYTLKLLIRKSLENNESRHIIYCTHCKKGD